MAKSAKKSPNKSKTTATKSKSTGLYPYTLQPIALNMSEAEFKLAQRSLFEQSTQNHGVASIKMTEWLVMAVTVALAIAGLVYVTGYSTILFWLMLAGVVIYLLARTLGLKWYMKREFDKQMADAEMPEEMQDMKLGVQKNGLVMSMPAPDAGGVINKKGKGKRGMQMQMAMPSHQQAIIPWSAVTSWDETADFMFIMFEMQGQTGSQIIPKRVHNDKFPIDSVRKHLLEVKEKGLQTDSMSR